ncbi:MAG: helix-turn-helix domain-containing protein [Bacteroidales bacterium]|nr:helix-turn-helix domain-containing protein [Bacteroidales bacterium]
MMVIDPVLYIGISQSFFAALLIATKRPFTVANRLMAAWVFLICSELIFALVNTTLLEVYSFPFISFTYGPLMYLYVRHMTNPGKKFNWLALVHFIPFLVFFPVSVIFRSDQFVNNLSSFFVPDRLIPLRIVYSVSFFLSISLYSALSFSLIARHQKNLKDLVSYTSGVITLNWLKAVSISFYTAYFCLFILGGLDIIGNYIPFDPYFVIYGFITVFSFVYSLYAIRQPEIFGQVLKPSDDTLKGAGRYSRSGLRNEKADEYLNRILAYMESSRAYLNRDLTIQDISSGTRISKHHITQVLNERHGKNFFTFINEYRVREVISRFSDPKYSNFTILAIALDSGFNSKATFNSIFKGMTGLTPSEFREKGQGTSRVTSVPRGPDK